MEITRLLDGLFPVKSLFMGVPKLSFLDEKAGEV
jgi:hypothetical protein